MNREEAIKEWIIPALKNTWNEKKNAEILKALEQEPCGKDINVPATDAISRQDVVKAVDKHTDDDGTLDDDITCILEDVPSAEPKTDVLDKIKAEIEYHRRKTQSIDPYDLVGDCLDIIDKYKAESEG